MTKTTDRAARIKSAIDESGMAQSAIADEIGVTRQSVTKWIKFGSIDKDNASRLAQLLGLSFQYLMFGERKEGGYSRNLRLHDLVEQMDAGEAEAFGAFISFYRNKE